MYCFKCSNGKYITEETDNILSFCGAEKRYTMFFSTCNHCGHTIVTEGQMQRNCNALRVVFNEVNAGQDHDDVDDLREDWEDSDAWYSSSC